MYISLHYVEPRVHIYSTVCTYCICGTLGGDFNLEVWRIWLQSPNLMYVNTTYNNVCYAQCTLSIALFANYVKCTPMCIMSQFAKYTAYMVYYIMNS